MMQRVFMMSVLVLVTVACVFSVACAPQAEEPEAPAVTQAEAEAAVREESGIFDKALNSGDADTLAELYVDEGRRYPPDEPPLIGKEAIRTGFQTGFEQYTFNIQNRVGNVILAGDLLIARGSFTGTRTPKAGGDPVEVSGHWIDYRRLQEDGSWKIVETMFVRDAPLPQE
jgi:ketosteroid isomerase-like protein